MLEITDAAQREIAFHLKGQERRSLRIYVEESGCAGPSFAITPDLPKDTDYVYVINGLQYLVDKKLMESAKPIKVDFGPCSFKITSGIQLCDGGCAGCGATGSCVTKENE